MRNLIWLQTFFVLQKNIDLNTSKYKFLNKFILLFYCTVICIFNEEGISHFYRSKDNYFLELHKEYVKTFKEIVAVYDTLKQLEIRVAEFINSKEYLLGKKIDDAIRKLKGFLILNNS